MTKITRRVAAGFGAAAFVIAGAAAISYAARPTAGPDIVRLVQPASDPGGVPDTTATTGAAPETTSTTVTTPAATPVTTTTTTAPTTTTTTAPAQVAPPTTVDTTGTTATTESTTTTTTMAPCPKTLTNAKLGTVRLSSSTYQWRVEVTNSGTAAMVIDNLEVSTDGHPYASGGNGVQVAVGATVDVDLGAPAPTDQGVPPATISQLVVHVAGRPDCH